MPDKIGSEKAEGSAFVSPRRSPLLRENGQAFDDNIHMRLPWYTIHPFCIQGGLNPIFRTSNESQLLLVRKVEFSPHDLSVTYL